MDLDNYENYVFDKKLMEEEAYGEYKEPLEQIRHHMELHPRDFRWIIQITLERHLSEQRLVELAREYLHVNIEIRILGHRQSLYGDLLLSCIIRRFTKTDKSEKNK
jgi:hypothetical protein